MLFESHSADGVYSIQHYVIKFVSDLQQVSGFPPGTPVSSNNETDCHDITKILLKVALNTINVHIYFCIWDFFKDLLLHLSLMYALEKYAKA